MHPPFRFPVLLLPFALAAGAFAAEPAGDAQTKEKLRVATVQLRDTQSELATVKSARDTLADDVKRLTEQVATLQKQVTTDGVAFGKTKTELNNRIAELEDEKRRLQAEVKEEREALALAQNLGQTREEARARVVEEKLAQGNVLAERERQNIELYRLANEILRRYEKFSLGEAMTAKEPFVGHTRAKLETLVQAYRDQLLAQRAPAKP